MPILTSQNCLLMSHNNLTVSRILHQLNIPTGIGRYSTPLGARLSVDHLQHEGSCLYPNVFCVLHQKSTISASSCVVDIHLRFAKSLSLKYHNNFSHILYLSSNYIPQQQPSFYPNLKLRPVATLV